MLQTLLILTSWWDNVVFLPTFTPFATLVVAPPLFRAVVATNELRFLRAPPFTVTSHPWCSGFFRLLPLRFTQLRNWGKTLRKKLRMQLRWTQQIQNRLNKTQDQPESRLSWSQITTENFISRPQTACFYFEIPTPPSIRLVSSLGCYRRQHIFTVLWWNWKKWVIRGGCGGNWVDSHYAETGRGFPTSAHNICICHQHDS